MILKRSEAIKLSSFIEFFNLSPDDKVVTIENALAGKELDKVRPEISNYFARQYMEYGLRYVLNEYLEALLTNHFGEQFEMQGRGPRMFPCFCCGYKTLHRRGEYDICEVCHWEDDGVDDLQIYSHVNHMTLFDAKNNFENFKIKSEVVKYSWKE